MSLQYSFGFESPNPPSLPNAGRREGLWQRGFEPPKPPSLTNPATNKLLILAKPDEETATRIARTADGLAAYLDFKGRLVRPELLHFTIHPIGLFSKVPQSIAEAVGACGNTVGMRPFAVSLNLAKNFHRKNGVPLIVLCGDDGVLGLRILHNALDLALTKTFGSGRSLPFEPHMTLSYKAMAIPDTPIEPITFTIREFVLVNSPVGQGRHIVLHRWRLGD